MKKILIANWKMQLDYKSSLELAKKFAKNFKKSSDELIICPDFSVLSPTAEIIKKSALKLGAQDVAAYSLGAYTGEVNAKSLKQLGVKYVLIGHSERRQFLGEDGKLLKLKVAQALEAGLVPVLCVGESAAQKKAKKTHLILKKQLSEVLDGLKVTDSKDLIVAYEPIWAIGTGRAILPQEAESNHVFIKGALAEIIGQIPRVLYGGSVNSQNAGDFLEWPNIDGLLVGGASLKVDEFSKIAKV